jgi:hypothetical protein
LDSGLRVLACELLHVHRSSFCSERVAGLTFLEWPSWSSAASAGCYLAAHWLPSANILRAAVTVRWVVRLVSVGRGIDLNGRGE